MLDKGLDRGESDRGEPDSNLGGAYPRTGSCTGLPRPYAGRQPPAANRDRRSWSRGSWAMLSRWAKTTS